MHPPAPQSQRISLSDEAQVKAILVDTVAGLWDIVNNLTRLRTTTAEHYRVTIFGSARSQPGSPTYEEVKRIARVLAEMDCDIITGGGPGLMQAANEGAAAADSPAGSYGIRVHLPFEQDVNPFVDSSHTHKTFFTRLQHFVLASDAFIVAPGGIGSLLETATIWQLLQVGHLKDVPLILVGKMWSGLVEWAEQNMMTFDPPLISPGDSDIPVCVDTADEAVEILKESQAKWKEGQEA